MKTKTYETIIKIGPDSLDELPALLKENGTKVLLVHGHRPVEDGLLTKVRLLLNKEGFPHANLGQILPNPKYGSVKRGIKVARKEKCDIILSLGGGSTLQCAKGIALGLGYKGDVWDFWAGKKKPKKVYPVASILTNPSSAAELSSTCTLVRKGKQESIVNDALKCRFAILDPKLSMYPFFPTMTQVFNLFLHLFYGALKGEEENYEQYLSLLKELLQATDALNKDIRNLEARDDLFKIGYESHHGLHTPSCPIKKLADKLAFTYSLTEGSAGSALFLSWLNTLDDEDQKVIIKIAGDLKGEPINTFDDALKEIQKCLEPTKLALSIPESGLIVSDGELKDFAQTKLDQKVLLSANKAHLDD